MNIDSIKSYPAFAEMKVKHRQENYSVPDCNRKNYAEECADKNEKTNRGYKSDSHTGIKNGAVTFGSAANTVTREAENVIKKAVSAASENSKKDNWFDKLLKLCDKHTVIAQNLVALGLATGPRVWAIMLMPGIKDKDDKYYASGHAIASGVIGFGFSSLVMYPLGQAAKKAKEFLKTAKLGAKGKDLPEETVKRIKTIFNVKNIADLEHSKAFKNVTKIMDMAPDVFVFGVLKAILTIKLIKPILKYGFGLEKKDKQNGQDNLKVQDNTSQKTKNSDEASKFASMRAVLKPEIQKFAGGLK